MLGRYVFLIFLYLRVFLSGLMTMSQVYEYYKGASAKSVPAWYYGASKTEGAKAVKFCCCQNGILRLKIHSFYAILHSS